MLFNDFIAPEVYEGSKSFKMAKNYKKWVENGSKSGLNLFISILQWFVIEPEKTPWRKILFFRQNPYSIIEKVIT